MEDKNVDPNEIRRMIDEVTFEETKELLVDLAIHFSKNTEIFIVPRGTTHYRVTKILDPKPFDRENPVGILVDVTFPLISFFGMYAGYNSQVDTLVLWEK